MAASIGLFRRRWHGALVAGLGALLLTTGCGDEGDAGVPAPARPTAAPGEPDAPQREARAVDPARTAALSGVVRYEGEVAAPSTIHMLGEAFCLQHHPPDGRVTDTSLLVRDGRLANAFVWIAEGLEGYGFDDPQGPVTLDQKGCLYEPRVLGVRVRQPLQVLNSDPVLHNVHSLPSRNRERNTGMPPGSKPREFVFKRPEIMVPMQCDVHAWMKAWVGVVEHPFFTVSGADGSWRMQGLPPGEYVLEAWHEVLGTRRVRVSVQPGLETSAEDLVFSGA